MTGAARDKAKDLALAGAIALFAVGGFVFVNPDGVEVFEGPGGLSWRSLPFLYAGLLLALTLLFAGDALRDLLRADRAAPAERPAPEPAGGPSEAVINLRRLATLVVLLAYVAGFSAFGFTLTTPVFLFCMFYVFGRTSLAANAGLALAGSAALWLLFVHILNAPLRGAVWDPVTPALSQALRAIGL